MRGVRGVLPAAIATRARGRELVIPTANAGEVALLNGLTTRPADHLLTVCRHLAGQDEIPVHTDKPVSREKSLDVDLSDVRGQHQARRALEVAAAGGHNILMIGPPGTGKTMLANRLATILPPMSETEALETAVVAPISEQGLRIDDWSRRPFRAPHHTASGVALVGGGSQPKPGEISLAHNGVLFLDELTEFDRHVLEVLREPLETGHITISRTARQADFPARFQLVAAMNPCPQGYACDLGANCRCTPEQRNRHRSRISAPLLDRIDLQIEVPQLPHDVLRSDAPRGETSAEVRARVIAARERQLARQDRTNAQLSAREVDRHCSLADAERSLLEQAMQRFHLCARAYHHILKVSRSIADLQDSPDIRGPHLAEALGYRAMDRWNGTQQIL